jgi:hypothetical protein
MAALKLAPHEMCPNFIASIFMTLASSPNTNLISGGEIKTIAINKNISDVVLTETITKSMIEIANRMGVPQHIATRELGEFRTLTTFIFSRSPSLLHR